MAPFGARPSCRPLPPGFDPDLLRLPIVRVDKIHDISRTIRQDADFIGMMVKTGRPRD